MLLRKKKTHLQAFVKNVAVYIETLEKRIVLHLCLHGCGAVKSFHKGSIRGKRTFEARDAHRSSNLLTILAPPRTERQIVGEKIL